MLYRMHIAQPDGVVGFVNSDVSIKSYSHIHKVIQAADQEPLKIRNIPKKIFERFIETGVRSEKYFIVSTRFDMDPKTEVVKRHTVGGYDFWAWNNNPSNPTPLLPFPIPPFRYPFGTYDNWLLFMVNMAGQRNVIDASEAIDLFHVNHGGRAGGSEGGEKSWGGILQTGVSGVYINRHLGFINPPGVPYSHINGFGTANEAPYTMLTNKNGVTIERRKYWSKTSERNLIEMKCAGPNKMDECEEIKRIKKMTESKRSDVANLLSGSFINNSWKGKSGAIKTREDLPSVEKETLKIWRYTLEKQLQEHARNDNFVLLTAVNNAYREQLLNFMCNLQRVGMKNNFIVAALDEEVYRWGVLQGLPIYLAGSVGKETTYKQSKDYNSKGFRSVTKLKSVAVLEVLQRGYSVVWSDVDITWFVNPFEALSEHMVEKGGIAIQTNAPFVAHPSMPAKPHESVDPVETDNPAAYHRLNSGLYVAPSNQNVIRAFKEITQHARKSKMSEQPSFDDVFCGKGSSERGTDFCNYERRGDSPVSMRVQTLDRFAFPNGAVLLGPTNDNVYKLGVEKFEKFSGTKLMCAHNNWIVGSESKVQRQIDRGWWFLTSAEEGSDENLMCSFLEEAAAE
ncbi:hypothetical protein TrLO_g11184 [Triparma laevis f. longispina]|uniref:Nucleotide-diphospho-sugar transferase domain-containing protein n=1 Tax=Triparma laevis f. longispina TaxID=1714387 RepID=A0A9W7FE69_9STRA|nr:hypothetical protein TrLO_g11184 [Triparma laevis f. longispina]